MTSWDIEIGPIWNQEDAEKKASDYIKEHPDLKWNRQWTTTIPGQMSVIGVCDNPDAPRLHIIVAPGLAAIVPTAEDQADPRRLAIIEHSALYPNGNPEYNFWHHALQLLEDNGEVASGTTTRFDQAAANAANRHGAGRFMISPNEFRQIFRWQQYPDPSETRAHDYSSAMVFLGNRLRRLRNRGITLPYNLLHHFGGVIQTRHHQAVQHGGSNPGHQHAWGLWTGLAAAIGVTIGVAVVVCLAPELLPAIAAGISDAAATLGSSSVLPTVIGASSV